MQKISAVIITYNEEKYIEQCIKSVEEVADEIIVVDSFSTDKTKEICLALGVKFIEHPFEGFRDQKNYALDQASFDYVLSLDADEALSPRLAKSIIAEKNNLTFDGYRFNRLNNFCGRWMEYTSIYPECKVRLFNKNKGRWTGHNIHEVVVMDNSNSIKKLDGNLMHWLYDSYEESFAKVNKYTTLSAQEYFNQGISVNFFKLILNPTWHFINSFIFRGGFLQGYDGFLVSNLQATTCFLKYIKLRRLYKIKDQRIRIIPHSQKDTTIDKQLFSDLDNNPIKIGFDAKRALYNFSGLGNYSRSLLHNLLLYYPKNDYYLFTPKTKKRYTLYNDDKYNFVLPSTSILKSLGFLWRSKYMIKDIKKNNIDIFHGLSQELPVGIEKTGAKSIVTVHDLIFMRFPEFYSWFDAKIYYRKLVYACRAADHVVAISTQTKNDLINLLNVSPDKISIIYQGCNPIYWKPIKQEFHLEVKAKHKLPDKYLLYVGTIEERKNLLGILKAIHEAKITVPLVVVGRKHENYFRSISNYISTNNLDNIIFTANVSNEELPSIYQNAECFIYPSFFEGFGIPILEALVSGTPVVTSKFGCFNEVAGPTSLYVNPYNIQEIGETILKVINNNELRSKMASSGKEFANRFKDEVVASNYMRLYNSLLKLN